MFLPQDKNMAEIDKDITTEIINGVDLRQISIYFLFLCPPRNQHTLDTNFAALKDEVHSSSWIQF